MTTTNDTRGPGARDWTVKPGQRWELRGYQVRDDRGRGRHIATYQTNEADGRLLAAAPELLDMLLLACDTLDACERASGTHSTADAIRAALTAMRLR